MSGRVSDKTLVTIFARCFRQIAKLSAGMDDGFFADLLNKGSERLLKQYLFFLRYEGTAEYVAQYRLGLIHQIKNILSLIDVLKHLGFTEPTTPLLLERDLLLLESLIRDSRQLKGAFNGKKNNLAQKPGKNQTKSLPLPKGLGQFHKQIAQFVTSRERVQNTDVFAKFSGITKRTLKRKLSELVKASVIKRTATGKKVFYVISDHN